MKNFFLILLSLLFTTKIFAHSTKNINFDINAECRKSKSALKWVSKNKYSRGGELIKFKSYTGFDQRTVITNGHKKNPIEITGYLQLPKNSNKVPIVIWTHSSSGPGEYAWGDFIYHGTQNLLNAGIGVMYIDNFCPRGAKDTWRDQSKVPIINGAIDAMMALKYLKNHPRSNGKFGTTGHSRGGNNSLFLADVKFTSLFLDGKKGFDAILPEAAECKLGGLFNKPELTSNTKLLYVHGGADDYTPPEPCIDYIKKIKANTNQIKIDIKEGWFHAFHSGSKPRKYPAMKVSNCPAFFEEWPNLVLNKYKIFSSLEEFYEAAQNEPNKTWKKSFKILKGEKCLERGVTIGGKHMNEYMPQFINFFKENLL